MSSNNWELAIVYTKSNNRYFVPFKILEKYVSQEIIDKIKVDIKKEINKL